MKKKILRKINIEPNSSPGIAESAKNAAVQNSETAF